MNKFWLTFRIATETVNNISSDSRRDALYDAIDNISPGWWVDSTSFIMFHTAKSIGDVATLAKAAIAPAYDLVLIRAVDTQDARVVGKVNHFASLQGYMPYVSKV